MLSPETAPAVMQGACVLRTFFCELYSTPLLLPLTQRSLNLSLSLDCVMWLFEFRKRMLCSFQLYVPVIVNV